MATDPVCGMRVNEQDAAGRLSYQGKDYFFCSDNCLQQCKAAPARFNSGCTPPHIHSPPAANATPYGGKAKDPVCGMLVDKATALKTERAGRSYYFCSVGCQRTFESREQELKSMKMRVTIALGTSVALMVGVGKGAESGILIRGGEVLERAQKLTTVISDKTGTLTRDEPNVTDIAPLAGFDETDVLRFAAAVEAGSEHPLGEAIVRAAQHRELDLPQVSGFEAIPGHGIKGYADNQAVLLGNRRLFAREGIDTQVAEATMTRLEHEGKTAMLVGCDGRLAGIIAVADKLKPVAREAIADFASPGNPLWWRVLWPFVMMPSVADNLRGRVPGYLRVAGFTQMKARGLRAGLITFWTAVKPRQEEGS